MKPFSKLIKMLFQHSLDIALGAFCAWKPRNDKPAGLKWVWMGEDGWREVCSFCGGNCGQCGVSRRVGNVPASMSEMVKNLYRPAAMSDQPVSQMSLERMRRKRDQAWELAALARRDGDLADAERHTSEAQDWDRQIEEYQS